MASESKSSFVGDIVHGKLTAWFYGSTLQGEKVVFESIAGKDVADLKDALVAELGTRVNLGSFSLFRAEGSGGGDETAWNKCGAMLDAMAKLTEVCGTSDPVVFFVERSVEGTSHSSFRYQMAIAPFYSTTLSTMLPSLSISKQEVSVGV